MNQRYTAGAVLTIALIVIGLAIGAMNWMGQHQQQISAGVGTFFQVLIVVGLVAGAGLAVWLLFRRRQAVQDAEVPPAPVRAFAEQVPVQAIPVEEPLALPASGDVHLHFSGLSADEAADVVRQATRR